MQTRSQAKVSRTHGIADDFRGTNEGRNVVVLTREGWQAACKDLGQTPDWTTRRANLYVEGVDLHLQTGRRLHIGDVVLQITGECDPCARMDEAVSGLCSALTPDWRAGVTCIVISEGSIATGDSVFLESDDDQSSDS